MKKIFVGNLSWDVTEEDLKEAFEAFGAVISTKIVVDQYNGRSKGFGFIEMQNDEEADAAIAALNEQPLLGRNMRVSVAQDRPKERGDRRERSGFERREHSGRSAFRGHRAS